MEQENKKWQDTDPRQKDDRSEMVQTGTQKGEEKTERQDNDKLKKDKDEDLSFWEGTGSDGGAAGDGAAA